MILAKNEGVRINIIKMLIYGQEAQKMRINKINIKNFRKLDNCDISISDETTVFVGANNSGKTSAMYCLMTFLGSNEKRFKLTDFPLDKISELETFSDNWSVEAIENFCPTLEISLDDIQDIDLPKIKHLIPTLSWNSEQISVRLVFEPKDIDELKEKFSEYSESLSALETEGVELPLPKTLFGFLSNNNNLNIFFGVQAYLLDSNTETGNFKKLPHYPFNGIFKVSIVPAQRGFDDSDDLGSVATSLSKHLGAYYDKHINPKTMPTAQDIEVLHQINGLQTMVSEQLNTDFAPLIKELSKLGYPSSHGDPGITLKSEIDTSSIIKQNTTLLFSTQNALQTGHELPERHNGLGYRNIIFIFFQLLRFRDEWLRKNKASKALNDNNIIEPIHLVLIEEPEAHLHSQAQQIFIKNAFNILATEVPEYLTTHLLISTHSSYIAHESGFDSLTYFKRKKTNDNHPCSETIGLSTVFSQENQDFVKTQKFVSRYLKTMHCDLFFADAIIMVEGSAERILIPHFMNNKYDRLTSKYISILEVGGAYAHKFKPLIDALDLPTLVITDLDSKNADDKKDRPKRGQGYTSNCDELTHWLELDNRDLDRVLDLSKEDKVIGKSRIAYQIEIDVKFSEDVIQKSIPYTFEDALVLSNFNLFKSKDLASFTGMLKKMCEATHKASLDEACEDMFKALKGRKAVMALDILYEIEIEDLNVPNYIDEGLSWLADELANTSTGEIREL